MSEIEAGTASLIDSGLETIPDQLWVGAWVPAEDQPVDPVTGTYRPLPPSGL